MRFPVAFVHRVERLGLGVDARDRRLTRETPLVTGVPNMRDVFVLAVAVRLVHAVHFVLFHFQSFQVYASIEMMRRMVNVIAFWIVRKQNSASNRFMHNEIDPKESR